LRLGYSQALVVLNPPTLRYFATGKFRPLKIETNAAAEAGVRRVDVTDDAASQNKFSPTFGPHRLKRRISVDDGAHGV
jgi:hypothetical protein